MRASRVITGTEWFTAAYGVAFGALVWMLRRRGEAAWPLGVNLAVAALVLAALPRLRTRASAVARYFGVGLPLLAFYLYYREVAVVLSMPGIEWHDRTFVALERSLWTAAIALPRWAVAWLAGAYHAYVPLLVAATIAALGAGDAAGSARMRRMVAAVCLSWAVCDLVFVLYPVMGPRFVFPDLQWSRMGSGALARFARAYQEQGMLRGGAFPSAHVAGTVAVMAPLWCWRRTLFWALSPIAAGLVAGAVVFGYHYVSDVVVGAGVGTAVTALVAGRRAESRRVRGR
jgi:membrane-associated phospholipid phosphatase